VECQGYEGTEFVALYRVLPVSVRDI
jgi:hypothetical protein